MRRLPTASLREQKFVISAVYLVLFSVLTVLKQNQTGDMDKKENMRLGIMKSLDRANRGYLVRRKGWATDIYLSHDRDTVR